MWNTRMFPSASSNPKRVVGLTGPKVVHRYEASVKRGAATQKRASENIAELQDWILLKVGGRMRSA